MKIYCVYVIHNSKNDKKYVGVTSQGRETRLKAHKRCARNNSRMLIHKAMRKHGADNFWSTTIYDDLCRDEAFAMEREYIKNINSLGKNGYNQTVGGEGCTELSEEARRRKSDSSAKAHARPEVKERHRAGCKSSFDDERRAKISKAHKGKGMHPNAQAAIIAAKKTEKYKEIASNAAKKTWDSDGYKEYWVKRKLEKHILKAKRFPVREDGLIFSSTRAASGYMRSNGYPKAAPNNICLACNKKSKQSYGFSWDWMEGDKARAIGGIIT